jgi:hypothetical protein
MKLIDVETGVEVEWFERFKLKAKFFFFMIIGIGAFLIGVDSIFYGRWNEYPAMIEDDLAVTAWSWLLAAVCLVISYLYRLALRDKPPEE